MKYWTPAHQQLAEQYYYCQSATTSATTRNRILVQLMPVLNSISYQTLFKYKCLGINENERVNDITTNIIINAMDGLKEDKLKGTLQYLWVSAGNYVKSKYVKPKYNSYKNTTSTDIIDDDCNYNYVSDSTYESDYAVNVTDIKVQIIDELDSKIKQQKYINRTSALFLMEMKEYLIANDFDAREFESYIRAKLGLKETTYKSIMSRIGIRSKPFSEKYMKDEKKKGFF